MVTKNFTDLQALSDTLKEVSDRLTTLTGNLTQMAGAMQTVVGVSSQITVSSQGEAARQVDPSRFSVIQGGRGTAQSIAPPPPGQSAGAVTAVQQFAATLQNHAPPPLAGNVATRLAPPSINQQPNQGLGAALGYSTADIPRLNQLISQNTGTAVADAIKKLASDNSRDSQSMVRILQEVEESIKKHTSAYEDAQRKFIAAPAGSEVAQAALRQKLSAGQQLEEANRVFEEYQKYGGPGGGGGGGKWGARFGGFMRGVGSIAGAGVAGYQLYSGVSNAQDEVLKNAALSAATGFSGIEANRFRRMTESFDMTSAENIMRYGAARMFPGEKFQYIGSAESLRRSEQAGLERAGIQRDIESRSGIGTLLGGAGKIAGGLAAAIYSAPIPGVNLAVGGAGIAAMISGGHDIATHLLSSPESIRSGDIQTGLSGAFGRMRRGEQFDQLAGQASIGARGAMLNEANEYARKLQDEEIKTRPGLMIGIQQKLDVIEARRAATSMVGGAAHEYFQTPKTMNQEQREFYNHISGKYQRASLEREQNLDAARAEADGWNGPTGFTTLFEKFNPFASPKKAKLNLAQVQSSANVAAAEAAINNASTPEYKVAPVQDMATSMGMSYASWGNKRAQLHNFIGGVAGEGQTAEMFKLSTAGLGSYEQLLGNLGQLNQTVGGRDNTKTLEAVLSSAVAAGFDRSRTAQQFVSATTQLAENLKSANAESVATTLSAAALLEAGPGAKQSDERALRKATLGGESLGNYQTSSASAPILGAAAAARLGFKRSGNITTYAEATTETITGWIKRLESSKPIPKTEKELLSFLDESGGGRAALAAKMKESLADKRQEIARAYDSSLKKAGIKFVGGTKYENYEQWSSEVLKLPPEERRKAVEAMSAQSVAVGGSLTIGPEGLNFLLAQQFGTAYNKPGALGKVKSAGWADYMDSGAFKRQQILNTLAVGMSAESSFKGGAVQYFQEGAPLGDIRIPGEKGKGSISVKSAADYEKLTAENKKLVDQQVEKMDRFEIGRSLDAAKISESNAQAVHIVNMHAFEEAMEGALRKQHTTIKTPNRGK